MNNDTAKIVLQADLSKSAAAIAKQLPKLSDEIAQRGKLKIQAVIDPASIQEQAMSAMRQAQGLLSGQSLSLSVALDTDRLVLSDQLSAGCKKIQPKQSSFKQSSTGCGKALTDYPACKALSPWAGSSAPPQAAVQVMKCLPVPHSNMRQRKQLYRLKASSGSDRGKAGGGNAPGIRRDCNGRSGNIGA